MTSRHVAQQVRVDLRWSCPAEPAGIISSYDVLMATTVVGDETWNVTTLAGEQPATKFSFDNVPTNTVLHFKVSNGLYVVFSNLITNDEMMLPRYQEQIILSDLSNAHSHSRRLSFVRGRSLYFCM